MYNRLYESNSPAQPLLEGLREASQAGLLTLSRNFRHLPALTRSDAGPKRADYSGGTAPDFHRFPYYLRRNGAPEMLFMIDIRKGTVNDWTIASGGIKILDSFTDRRR
jgi:hypothetical protein